MRMTIAVLEDNEDRIVAMRSCLRDKFPFYELSFFLSAPEAIDWLKDHASSVICLSLDHDLEPALGAPAGTDPGTGREVADFLADRDAGFPIIVHSTNLHAAIGMEAVLEEVGWSVERVAPYGDLEWVTASWLPAIRNAIVAHAGHAAAQSAP
jgi:CheY-like chemotaxis protein